MRTADPATGQQGYGKVARTFVGEVEKILEVETADGARVTATEGHPFFVEGRGFIAARKLARGDLLRRVGGRRVAVVGLGWEEAHTRVYNFEVERTHTYYAGGVWVHNARPCFDPREQAIADYLQGLGRSVERNPLHHSPQGGRQADALVDGLPVEFKSLDSGGSNSIKNAVADSVRSGGQARTIVIDGRGTGLTEGEAWRGIGRVLGIGYNREKLDHLAVIGDGFFVGRGTQ